MFYLHYDAELYEGSHLHIARSLYYYWTNIEMRFKGYCDENEFNEFIDSVDMPLDVWYY